MSNVLTLVTLAVTAAIALIPFVLYALVSVTIPAKLPIAWYVACAAKSLPSPCRQIFHLNF